MTSLIIFLPNLSNYPELTECYVIIVRILRVLNVETGEAVVRRVWRKMLVFASQLPDEELVFAVLPTIALICVSISLVHLVSILANEKYG